MTLQQQTIEELKQIILADYGREITFAEASEIARNLVGYYDTLARVYHQTQIKDEDTKTI